MLLARMLRRSITAAFSGLRTGDSARLLAGAGLAALFYKLSRRPKPKRDLLYSTWVKPGQSVYVRNRGRSRSRSSKSPDFLYGIPKPTKSTNNLYNNFSKSPRRSKRFYNDW